MSQQQHTPTSEVLNRAADLIEEHGWGWGPSSMTAGQGLCLMGGIYAATYGQFREEYREAAACPAGRAVYDYLSLDPRDSDAGWEWNDEWLFPADGAPAENLRTQDEVIEVLRAAAAIEQAREWGVEVPLTGRLASAVTP